MWSAILNVIRSTKAKLNHWYPETLERWHIYGLVQERRNSIANALELLLSCTNPMISNFSVCILPTLYVRCKVSVGIVISMYESQINWWLNPLRPRQNGRHFTDDIFKRIFVNENARISIKFSLKFVSKSPINNIPALVQIMARRRPGNKPLSEPVMVSLLTHICVTRPQWVNAKKM